MADKKHNPLIDTALLVFSGLALVAAAFCYAKGKDIFLSGVDASVSMIIQLVPRMIAAFLIAGFVEVLIPKDVVSKWIGEKSGFKGILIATVAGALTPGGPITSFPFIFALYKLGADFGPLVAYLTAWELLAFQRILVWEIPLMGMHFVSQRLCVSLVLPILAGFIARGIALHFGSFARMREGA